MDYSCWSLCGMNPGPRRAIIGLKGANLVVTLQGQRDLVEPQQQPLTPPRVDFERVLLARWRDNRLRLQIDPDPPRTLGRFDVGSKRIHDLLVDEDGEDSVLEAIGEENVAKAGTDDGTNAHFLQRPNGSFARRAAAEIRTGDENFRVPVRLPVQDEVRILRAVRQIAQRAERPFAERAANGVADQALDADDHIGVDIAAHDRCGDGGQFVELFWHLKLNASWL